LSRYRVDRSPFLSFASVRFLTFPARSELASTPSVRFLRSQCYFSCSQLDFIFLLVLHATRVSLWFSPKISRSGDAAGSSSSCSFDLYARLLFSDLALSPRFPGPRESLGTIAVPLAPKLFRLAHTLGLSPPMPNLFLPLAECAKPSSPALDRANLCGGRCDFAVHIFLVLAAWISLHPGFRFAREDLPSMSSSVHSPRRPSFRFAREDLLRRFSLLSFNCLPRKSCSSKLIFQFGEDFLD
jgi:hypothetical protein